MNSQRGYVLIEAIVALAVMAIASAGLITVFSQGVRSRAIRIDVYEMHAFADSLLAQTASSLERGAQVGDRSGADSGLAWTVNATIIDARRARAKNIELVRISATLRSENKPRNAGVEFTTYVIREVK